MYMYICIKIDSCVCIYIQQNSLFLTPDLYHRSPNASNLGSSDLQ